ncbi:MAG: hypothetical protein AAFR28_05230 [Pseudomonadota bacterium]
MPTIGLRLDGEVLAALDAICSTLDCNRSDLLRQIIQQAIDANPRSIKELGAASIALDPDPSFTRVTEAREYALAAASISIFVFCNQTATSGEAIAPIERLLKALPRSAQGRLRRFLEAVADASEFEPDIDPLPNDERGVPPRQETSGQAAATPNTPGTVFDKTSRVQGGAR